MLSSSISNGPNLKFRVVKQGLKGIKFKIVVLYPKIKYPISNAKGLGFPFSFNYIIQSYYRLKSRKGHDTLDYDKNPKAHYILLSFLTLYRNSYFHVNNPLMSLYPISFTDESEEIKLDKETRNLFFTVVKEVSRKPFENSIFVILIRSYREDR